MEKMSILMGKLGQQKVASGPVQQKKLVLLGWVCLHEHPPFWQFIPLFSPFHAGVLRRTTPCVCNAFQWLWNLSTNLCLFLKFLGSVKKGPPWLKQARTELIFLQANSTGKKFVVLSLYSSSVGQTCPFLCSLTDVKCDTDICTRGKQEHGFPTGNKKEFDHSAWPL